MAQYCPRPFHSHSTHRAQYLIDEDVFCQRSRFPSMDVVGMFHTGRPNHEDDKSSRFFVILQFILSLSVTFF